MPSTMPDKMFFVAVNFFKNSWQNFCDSLEIETFQCMGDHISSFKNDTLFYVGWSVDETFWYFILNKFLTILQNKLETSNKFIRNSKKFPTNLWKFLTFPTNLLKIFYSLFHLKSFIKSSRKVLEILRNF